MISAIVPVWNGRDLLAKLLDTLDAQTLRAGELLVVDNGSSDGAPEMASGRGARVIPMGRNAGFAAAVNRGIREARGEWVAVLNSDVELAPDYFVRLVATDAWFATGKLLRTGADEIDGAFDLTCRGGTTWRAGSGCRDGGAWSHTQKIVSPPWTAVLFRASVFERVGLLEESFESYLEDVDFGLRCARAGVTGTYDPAAVAWHRGSAALGRWHADTVRRIARNQVLLLARHFSDRDLTTCWWPILVAHLLWGGLALRHGRALAWLQGKVAGAAAFQAARARSFDSGLLERLRAAERVIGDLQPGDAYWKLYFALCPK